MDDLKIVGYTFDFDGETRTGFQYGTLLLQDGTHVVRNHAFANPDWTQMWKRLQPESVKAMMLAGGVHLFDEPLEFSGRAIAVAVDTPTTFELFVNIAQAWDAVLHVSQDDNVYGLLLDADKVPIPIVKLYGALQDALNEMTSRGLDEHSSVLEKMLKELDGMFPLDDYVKIAEAYSQKPALLN